MAVRTPLYWDGSSLREMSSTMVTQLVNRAINSHTDPSAALNVVSSSGSLTAISDTRMQAGAARSFSNRFPTEGETAEPSQITVSYDKISQQNASVSQSDTNNRAYPVFWNGSDIQCMSATDMFDTFINSAISTLTDGNDRPGIFRIHTSTSLSGHTLKSSTPVFSDTRANTGAYTAGGITETQDQPTTITNYYLFRKNAESAVSYTAPLKLDDSSNLQAYSDATLDAMFLAEIRYHTVNTSGSRIVYSINGAGNNRGSGMVDTRLNGSGSFNTRFINSNDYRAQEFPNGSAITVNTYFLKMTRS
tara:strand:+ start:72 stop:986 length:915 start_codon:yes stop_codon:yes gene_type:complete